MKLTRHNSKYQDNIFNEIHRNFLSSAELCYCGRNKEMKPSKVMLTFDHKIFLKNHSRFHLPGF